MKNVLISPSGPRMTEKLALSQEWGEYDAIQYWNGQQVPVRSLFR